MRYSWLLAGILFLAAGCEKQQVRTEEKTTRVTLANLEKRIFQQRIPVQGTIQPVEFATISAKISGTLEVLQAEEGDVVKKGDLLFSIDRQVLRNQVVVKEDEIKVREAALASSESALNIARIGCEQAERNYLRAKNLLESKAISTADFEIMETEFKKAQMQVNTAEAEVANARAQLQQARSNLAIARKNLDDSVISAPFDCVITDTMVEENEYVSSGQPILRLENHNQLEVVCFLSAVYYDQVIPGVTAVDFTGRDGQAFARSKVTYKAPAIDPESRTFKVKISVPQDAGMVSGMLCELNIILTERESYGLPEAAVLLRANDLLIAYTIDAEKRARSVTIQRGIVDGGYAEILNGNELLEHRFVITGQTFINNGSLLVEAVRAEN
ncbi:MAG: efflux RND transporter periplasmic adaptor subunit [Lentisphaeria bacterium]|nr:efflux RND transporter periplasmic adaptor subunit [Lentisphaeria bacterium]